MANEKAKAKGRKIGRNSKKVSTARGKERYNRCQDNRAKRILNIVLNGNPKFRSVFGSKPKPTLIDQQDGTFKISGYPGYIYIAHNKSIVRKK